MTGNEKTAKDIENLLGEKKRHRNPIPTRQVEAAA